MLEMEEKLLTIAGLASAVLGLVLGYFIYTLVRQHRAVTIWQQDRIRAEVETLEAERKRIAMNLHDDIGPKLSAIKLHINQIEPPDSFNKSLMEKSSTQIDEVIQHFRDVSFELLPNTLVRYGIAAATDELIDRLPAGQLTIHFKAEEILLNKSDEINLFRIIQEIIHNTIKHAKASVMEIKISNVPPDIILETADNGIGFIFNEKIKNANGIGLLSIQSRVEILKGRMTISTQPGKGTQYKIEIPLLKIENKP